MNRLFDGLWCVCVYMYIHICILWHTYTDNGESEGSKPTFNRGPPCPICATVKLHGKYGMVIHPIMGIQTSCVPGAGFWVALSVIHLRPLWKVVKAYGAMKTCDWGIAVGGFTKKHGSQAGALRRWAMMPTFQVVQFQPWIMQTLLNKTHEHYTFG